LLSELFKYQSLELIMHKKLKLRSIISLITTIILIPITILAAI